MSYVITQCCLLPDASEGTLPQPGRPILDLPTPEGWKAELTRWFVTELVYLSVDEQLP